MARIAFAGLPVEVRVSGDRRGAVGEPGEGLDGFRASHADAQTALRVQHALGPDAALVTWAREVRIDLVLARLLYAHGGDGDARTRGLRTIDRLGETDELEALITWHRRQRRLEETA